MSDFPSFVPAGVLRALAYRSVWFLATGLQKAATACSYLSAGLLRRADLSAASKQLWARKSDVADLDVGLEAWEQRVYDGLLRRGDRILLIGCGEGRDLIALLRAGYSVTGLEHSPHLVHRARSHLAARNLSAVVLESSVEDVVLPHAYDVIIFSMFSYGLVPGSDVRSKTLARLRAYLAPGGRMVFSYAVGAGHSTVGLALLRAAARLVRSDWAAEPGDTFAPAVGAAGLLFYQHFFQPRDFAAECARAGLNVVRDEQVLSTAHYALAVRADQLQEAAGSAPNNSDSRSRISIPAVTSALPPMLMMLS
jgi:SAM-dependent methyltransferase